MASSQLPAPDADIELGTVTISKAVFSFRVASASDHSLIRVTQNHLTFWIAAHSTGKGRNDRRLVHQSCGEARVLPQR